MDKKEIELNSIKTKEELTIGNKFGLLTLVKTIHKGQRKTIYWECQCECGGTTFVTPTDLRKKKKRSCGCLKKKNKNLLGQKFGRLTVISDTGRKTKRGVIWECICDCGNTKEVPSSLLTSGNTSSCGCLAKEIQRDRAKKLKTTHGLSDTRIYRIWKNMIDRCTNKNNVSYHNYGGRGIDVYKQWLKLELFVEWAYRNGYKDDLKISRINIDKGYCPENCTWSTTDEINKNRRGVVWITIEGETKTLSDWSKLSGIPATTIKDRLNKGITGSELLNPTKKSIKIEVNGKLFTLKEISEEYQIPLTTVYSRFKKGWSVEEIIWNNEKETTSKENVVDGSRKKMSQNFRRVLTLKKGQEVKKWIVEYVELNNEEHDYIVGCKCKNCDDFMYISSFELIKQGVECLSCEQIKDEINHELYVKKLQELNTNITLKEGVVYKNKNTKLTHICPECNEDWDVPPRSILNGSSMCYKCRDSKFESRMATALKQVFKHNYKETIHECDLGFRGDRGGISRYDIYIPELNLVVECQSEYHDSEEQTELDEKKKQYAISKGINYEALDSRDYSPLKAIQYFFPQIKKIPEYVDFSAKLTRSWSLEEAQELLDQGYFYNEVANMVNTTRDAISIAVNRGILTLPEGYIKETDRNWSLEEAQYLLDEQKYNYKQIAEILGNGCTARAIHMAIQRKQLKRPKYKKIMMKNTKPFVFQFTLDERFVESHNTTVIDGFHSSGVSLACRGLQKRNPHEHKGYLWYYHDTIPHHLKPQIQIPQNQTIAS